MPARPGSSSRVSALEIARLEMALAAAQRALQTVRHQISQASPLNIAEFIDAHLLMLEDAALVDEVREIIRDQLFAPNGRCSSSATIWRASSTRWTTPTCAPAATTSSMSSIRS